MEDTNRNLSEEEISKRESGEPGGGQGRRDEVGKTPIYPVSAGKFPDDDDAYIRTPGEFGQRGRGLEGYYDHGEGGVVTQGSNAAAQPGDEGATQQTQSSGKSKIPGAGEETA